MLAEGVSNFTIIGESLYYTISEPESGYMIYKAGLDRKNPQELPVGMLKPYSNYYIAGDFLYYTDARYGDAEQMDGYHKIIVWDMRKEEAVAQIKVPDARMLAIRGIWDGKLVYSDEMGGGANSGCCDIETGECFPLDTVSPAVMIADDTLFYAGDGDKNDLWAWKAGDAAPRKLIEGQMGHFCAQEGWLYYCPDDSFLHWKRYSLTSGETQSLPKEVIGMPVSRSQPDKMPSDAYYY